MANIVLLGDSIIDNKTYVGSNERSVEEHLNELSSENIIRIALDGDTTKDVLNNQLKKIDPETTHAVLSIGGNDLLDQIDILFTETAYTLAAALDKIVLILDSVENNYQKIIKKLIELDVKILLCTVYEGDLKRDPILSLIEKQGLAMVSLLNDSITLLAKKYNIDVLELRNIFVTPEDYANPIEPSHIGGEKYAKKILEWVESND